jgi:nucleotide-binding universal stress UspA family protein
MNILIAIDSSPAAQAALVATLARDWPERTNFRVLTVLPARTNWLSSRKAISSDLIQAHELIDRATAQIEILNPDSTAIGVVDLGDPAKCILEFARSWPADLIVTGAQNRGMVSRLLKKSVSRTIFQNADCSLLIARSLADLSETSRVLVYIDDSFNSTIAVDAILDSDWPKDTKFKLITAVDPDYKTFCLQPNVLEWTEAAELHDEYLFGIHESLEHAKMRLEEHLGTGRVDCAVGEGEPEQVILDVAKDWSAQLIIVGSSERPGLPIKLFGSLSQTIAHSAPCSVQAVRLSVEPLRARIEAAQRKHREENATPYF